MKNKLFDLRASKIIIGTIIIGTIIIGCLLSTRWYVVSYVGLEKQNMYDNIYIGIASFISALGTVFLGCISIQQSSKSYYLSEKLAKLTRTEYLPIFSIEHIKAKKYDRCNKNNSNTITLNTCHIMSTPDKCSSYIISLKNDGCLPITKITVSHNKSNKQGYQDAEKELYLARNESMLIDVCTVDRFDNNELVIKAENIAGYEFSLKISISIVDNVVKSWFCRML